MMVETLNRKLPTHEVVYRRIREMILFGELAPGQAVTIQGLVAHLDTGMTPVREAIRRLTAEGALELRGNRRACVSELTLKQLDELSFARLEIEPRLAFLGAKNMTSTDMDALHTIDQALDVAIARGEIQAYLRLNYRFHTTLYRLSDAKILTAIAGTLWLRVGPSLRVVCGRLGTQNLPDKHREALAAMRARAPRAVAEAIREDLHQGHEQIRLSLTKGRI